MGQDVDNLIWVDLEMTGLEVASSAIIEIAVIVTDKDLKELGRWPAGQQGLAIFQPASLLEGMDEWNRRTHGGTGLLERVRRSAVQLAEAEAQALDFVRRHCPPPVPDRRAACPLAGNSIGQDRAFLRAYMPELERYTSYRNVDVSTIKELVKRWYPGRSYDKPELGQHGAMTDILASIEELRYYRTAVFVR